MVSTVIGVLTPKGTLMKERSATSLTALIAIGMAGLILGEPASACSCVHAKQSNREMTKWLSKVFDRSENVVLVRTVSTIWVIEHDRQIANLQVLESWKGKHAVGDIIESDTRNIGGGMCDSSTHVNEELILYFQELPIRITGCPSDKADEVRKRKILDKLSKRRR